VLGGVRDLPAVQPPSCCLRRQRLVQGRSRMGVEVSAHQRKASRLRSRHVEQCTDACGPVPCGPACRHPDMTPASPWCATPQWVASPCTLLCRVLASAPPSTPRPGGVDLPQQWLAGFVHPEDGRASIVGPWVAPKHVLPVRHAVGLGGGRQAPRVHLPQLALGLFHAWRMVSREARTP
jgi:hypothetical protein